MACVLSRAASRRSTFRLRREGPSTCLSKPRAASPSPRVIVNGAFVTVVLAAATRRAEAILVSALHSPSCRRPFRALGCICSRSCIAYAPHATVVAAPGRSRETAALDSAAGPFFVGSRGEPRCTVGAVGRASATHLGRVALHKLMRGFLVWLACLQSPPRCRIIGAILVASGSSRDPRRCSRTTITVALYT